MIGADASIVNGGVAGRCHPMGQSVLHRSGQREGKASHSPPRRAARDPIGRHRECARSLLLTGWSSGSGSLPTAALKRFPQPAAPQSHSATQATTAAAPGPRTGRSSFNRREAVVACRGLVGGRRTDAAGRNRATGGLHIAVAAGANLAAGRSSTPPTAASLDSTMPPSSCSRYRTGASKVVQRGGYYGRYLRSGHLVRCPPGDAVRRAVRSRTGGAGWTNWCPSWRSIILPRRQRRWLSRFGAETWDQRGRHGYLPCQRERGPTRLQSNGWTAPARTALRATPAELEWRGVFHLTAAGSPWTSTTARQTCSSTNGRATR